MLRELAELHKANVTKDSEAQVMALSREVQAKDELSLALEKAQEESCLQQEALANQVTHSHLKLFFQSAALECLVVMEVKYLILTLWLLN